MYEKYFEHKPKGISEEIKEYIENVVLSDAHYIFYERKNKKQIAFCTKCKHEFTTSGMRHNEENECPYCFEKFKTKAKGKGRSALVHIATFIWYEKSIIDSNVVVARGFTVIRDYSKDIYEIVDGYREEAFYYFSSKESKMFKNDWWSNKWVSTESVYKFNINSLARYEFWCSKKNIENTIENTCLKYSCIDEFRKQGAKLNTYRNYLNRDLLKYFEFYLKYPQIEKLLKIGLGNLVGDRIEGGILGSSVNWRAKEVHKMLKITKGELKEITKNQITVTPLFLKLYQLNSKNIKKLTISELKDLEYIVYYPGYVNYIDVILKYTTLKKLYKYINKQYETKQYKGMSLILSDWKDYIFDAKKLEIDLSIESNLMPKDLYITHQNTIKQIKYNNDLELMRKTKARNKELQKYSYKSNGLFIRAPKDSKEIIEEGKIQHICVGGYAGSHANGDTTILFIRKVDDPKTPYYTVEIKDGVVVQVRGKRNCDTTKEIEKFIRNFEKARLVKNKKKSKIA